MMLPTVEVAYCKLITVFRVLLGAVILLGRTNMFRFNHPKEAAKLREKRKVSCMKSPGASSDLGGAMLGCLHSGA